MFIRTKHRGSCTYLQIVRNHRVEGKVVQHIVGTLGRLDLLRESGELDAMMVSLGGFSEKLAALGEHAKISALAETEIVQRVGAPMIFERLWRELGIARVIQNRLRGRRFEFPVERAIFLSVLHRLVSPGSDRNAEQWKKDYRIAGAEKLELHHFYRAMAWLGTPLPQKEQDGATPFAPRCTKDLIEEDLYTGRRDLFTGLDLVFFDTTSIYFEGNGGETLGQYGHSKDHRPDLKQMVVGAILDNRGNPVCAEIWPGNTTDVKTLLPIAERLKKRFQIERICLVADRGMTDRKTMAELEHLGWKYILGVRMRVCKEVRDDVLNAPGVYEEVTPERKASRDPAPLKVKEVKMGQQRYIVCLNEEEARKDRHDREAILASLREALKHSDKALIGNKGYRRYLECPKEHFVIDEKKVSAESRYDGTWVLTTNTDLSAAETALTYKHLLLVEDIFRSAKSLLETRPIFHKTDETIRGHVWCSFLALLLRKELQDRLEKAKKGANEKVPEWADVIRDLEALGDVVIGAQGKQYRLRTKACDAAIKTFAACGVALPSQIGILDK